MPMRNKRLSIQQEQAAWIGGMVLERNKAYERGNLSYALVLCDDIIHKYRSKVRTEAGPSTFL